MLISPRVWCRIGALALSVATLIGCASPGATEISGSAAPAVAEKVDRVAQSIVGPPESSPGSTGDLIVPAASTPVRTGGSGSTDSIMPPEPDRSPDAPVVIQGGGTVPPRPAGLEKIKHFVFIMQENRSFDSYFGTYQGVDGLPSDVCLPDPYGGPCVTPYHDPNLVDRGGPHDWDNAVSDVNDGAMDGFLIQAYDGASKNAPAPCLPTKPKCKPGSDPRDVMGYHDYREIPNYWNYAHLYVLQDHVFSPVLSYTLPNRLYALAGQSGGLMQRAKQPAAPSFDFPTIADELSARGIDWKFYVTSGKQPDTDDGHVVGVGSNLPQKADSFSLFNPLPAFPRLQGNPVQRQRLVDTTQFYADASTGNLPAVSWVVPNDAVGEHPPSSVAVGMAYVTGLVNAVMESPDWNSTAIFISYDEWGGFYDHVAPPSVDSFGYGVRVPGLVISPYARQGYVDHQPYSTEAWLRVVEERYGLPNLTARDAQVGDMLAAFDFTQHPRPPVILAATPKGSPYPHAPQVIVH